MKDFGRFSERLIRQDRFLHSIVSTLRSRDQIGSTFWVDGIVIPDDIVLFHFELPGMRRLTGDGHVDIIEMDKVSPNFALVPDEDILVLKLARDLYEPYENCTLYMQTMFPDIYDDTEDVARLTLVRYFDAMVRLWMDLFPTVPTTKGLRIWLCPKTLTDYAVYKWNFETDCSESIWEIGSPSESAWSPGNVRS